MILVLRPQQLTHDIDVYTLSLVLLYILIVQQPVLLLVDMLRTSIAVVYFWLQTS